MGPGSYTGIRVGITFARTLGQIIPGLKLVPVPTALAVAENIASIEWRRLGVLLAARENVPWGILIERDGRDAPQIAGKPEVAPVEDLVEKWGTPLVLTGEGLGYCTFSEIEGVEIIPEKNRYPAVQSVWAAGRRLANRGKYVNFCELLPLYARRPEAVRLWEQREDKKN